MSFKEKIREWNLRQAQKKAGEKELKKLERIEYHKAKLNEVKILAKERARAEREEKVRRIRESVRRTGGGGFGSAFARRINIAATNLGYAPKQQPVYQTHKKKRRKGKKGKTKTIIKYVNRSQQPQRINPLSPSGWM